MAINNTDNRQKIADALRIQQTLTDLITTEDRFITNTRASANKVKQSHVLEKLAHPDVFFLRFKCRNVANQDQANHYLNEQEA